MADDEKTTDETVESAKVVDPVAAPAGRRSIDRRSAGLGALAVGALVLAFFAGMAIGDHDGDDDRFERVRDGHGAMLQGRGERGGMHGRGRGGERGARGGPGMQGGRGGGMQGRGGGERGGMQGRGGHGGAGVVESASNDELTVAPLGGRVELLTVKLDEDTQVRRRGDAGARDLEDAEVSDIDEGDIVMVKGSPDEIDDDADDDDDDAATTATINAKTVVILRDGDE